MPLSVRFGTDCDDHWWVVSNPLRAKQRSNSQGVEIRYLRVQFLFKMNDQDLPGSGPPGEQGQPLESAEWKEIVRKYQQPSRSASVWQIANTLGPYTALRYGS
jgi:hypothetical protein